MSDPIPSSSVPWLGCILRAFLPQRWLAALVAMALSAGVLALLSAWFVGVPEVDPFGWLQRPHEQFERWLTWAERTRPLTVLFAAALALCLLGPIWSLAGGFIARDEFVRWFSPAAVIEPHPSPAAFVVRWGGVLAAHVPMVVGISGLFFLVPLFAAGILYVPSGAAVAALVLPVLWTAVLLLALVVGGLVGMLIQPAAVAAEGSDHFDALSRSYSYLFQRPVLFLALEGLAVVMAGAPLFGLARWLEANPQAVSEAARPWTVHLALGLSLSLLWSQQPAVYAVMRYLVDGTSTTEVYAVDPATAARYGQAGPAPAKVPDPAPVKAQAEPQPAGILVRLWQVAFAAVAVPGSWLLMGRLMTWLVGERAAWLRWELYPFARPTLEGIDQVASWGAGFWLFLGLLFCLVPLRAKPSGPVNSTTR